MQQLHELLNRSMTRKQFLGVLGVGLASVFGAGNIAKKLMSDPAASKPRSDATGGTTSYGAWRPRSPKIG